MRLRSFTSKMATDVHIEFALPETMQRITDSLGFTRRLEMRLNNDVSALWIEHVQLCAPGL